MIQAKLLFLEQELIQKPEKNKDLLEALFNLRELLKQIDFSAEVVSLESSRKLSKLFRSLKNKPLTEKEIIIIRRLIKV